MSIQTDEIKSDQQFKNDIQPKVGPFSGVYKLYILIVKAYTTVNLIKTPQQIKNIITNYFVAAKWGGINDLSHYLKCISNNENLQYNLLEINFNTDTERKIMIELIKSGDSGVPNYDKGDIVYNNLREITNPLYDSKSYCMNAEDLEL